MSPDLSPRCVNCHCSSVSGGFWHITFSGLWAFPVDAFDYSLLANSLFVGQFHKLVEEATHSLEQLSQVKCLASSGYKGSQPASGQWHFTLASPTLWLYQAIPFRCIGPVVYCICIPHSKSCALDFTRWSSLECTVLSRKFYLQTLSCLCILSKLSFCLTMFAVKNIECTLTSSQNRNTL